jgi:transcription antitermination factor NusG
MDSMCFETSDLGTYVEKPVNSASWGGPRANSGGARPGAGRPRKRVETTAPIAGTHWYCVCVEYGQDTRVAWALKAAGFHAWLMWHTIPAKPARRTEFRNMPARPAYNAPAMPGYLFVKFDASNSSWRRIASIRGVVRIMGTSPERPTPLYPEVMSILMDQCDDLGVMTPPRPVKRLGPVVVGAEVGIGGEGPFSGLRGLCQWSTRERVQILLHSLAYKIEIARSEVAE